MALDDKCEDEDDGVKKNERVCHKGGRRTNIFSICHFDSALRLRSASFFYNIADEEKPIMLYELIKERRYQIIDERINE